MPRQDRRNRVLNVVSPDRIPAFNRALGMDSVRAGEGCAEISVELRDEFRNLRGVAHGGLIAALLDAVLGSAVVSAIRPEEWCGTVQLSVQFREPGEGDRLVGRGRITRRGRRIAFAEGEVTDTAGRIVASAHGTWHVWPTRPGTRPPARTTR